MGRESERAREGERVVCENERTTIGQKNIIATQNVEYMEIGEKRICMYMYEQCCLAHKVHFSCNKQKLIMTSYPL